MMAFRSLILFNLASSSSSKGIVERLKRAKLAVAAARSSLRARLRSSASALSAAVGFWIKLKEMSLGLAMLKCLN